MATVGNDRVTLTLSPRLTSDTTTAVWILPTPSLVDPAKVVFPNPSALVALDRASAPLLLGPSCETLYPGAIPTPGDSATDSDSKSLFGQTNGRGPFGCLADRRYDPNPPWTGGWWDTGTVLDPLASSILIGAWDTTPTLATYDIESWDSNSSEAMITALVSRGTVLPPSLLTHIRDHASAGKAFLVASTDWDTAQGPTLLSPIQFELPLSPVAFPLGWENLDVETGTLRIYVLNERNLGRAALIDGERRAIADDCMPPLETSSFSRFVDNYVAETLSGTAGEPTRWTVETSLERGDCSPCGQGEPFDTTSATALGWTEPLDHLF